MKYPTREHFPISPHELELPPSRLNLEIEQNFNNHHGCFYRKRFEAVALSALIRNLEAYQWITPKDTHIALHNRYQGIDVPPVPVMMDRMYEAKESGERLRYGPANYPEFVRVDDVIWQQLLTEYNTIGEVRYVQGVSL